MIENQKNIIPKSYNGGHKCDKNVHVLCRWNMTLGVGLFYGLQCFVGLPIKSLICAMHLHLLISISMFATLSNNGVHIMMVGQDK